MARLTHNDYLEQFSDSGILGGLAYAAWIILALATIGKKTWRNGNGIELAIFAGLLGWFAQGLGEFGLYIPALAWTAFMLLGCGGGGQAGASGIGRGRNSAETWRKASRWATGDAPASGH